MSMLPVHSEKNWIKSLPNQLTLFRMAVIPIILLLYPLGFRSLELFSAFLFALGSISDGLDGFIARKFNASSKLGSVLDPVADKMLTAAALVLLAGNGVIYTWVAALFLCREVGISGLRHIAAERNIEISVSAWGKWKTFILDVSLTCMFVNENIFGWPWVEVGMICLWVSLALSLYSAWEYSTGFWKQAEI